MDIAEKEYSFEDFEEFENTAQQAIYLGAVIVAGNASALNNSAQAKFLIAGNFRGLHLLLLEVCLLVLHLETYQM